MSRSWSSDSADVHVPVASENCDAGADDAATSANVSLAFAYLTISVYGEAEDPAVGAEAAADVERRKGERGDENSRGEGDRVGGGNCNDGGNNVESDEGDQATATMVMMMV